MAKKQNSVLPGFRLTLGYTLLYLSLIVLIPLAATFVKTQRADVGAILAHGFFAAGAGGVSPEFRRVVFAPRWSTPFSGSSSRGCWCAIIFLEKESWTRWWICRSRCRPPSRASRWRRFTRRTAGLGEWLAPLGIKVSYTQLGIFVALTFIGLPFIVRTVQPVLDDLDPELEEAAASLGANRWQTFWRVIFPLLSPALLTGFALAFARALGEYGSVVFISSNMPMKTQIVPLLIMSELDGFRLRQGDRAGRGDARRFVPAAAGDQSAAMVEQPLQRNQSDMTDDAKYQRPAAASERTAVRAPAAHCHRAGVSRAVSGRAARVGLCRGAATRALAFISRRCATR